MSAKPIYTDKELDWALVPNSEKNIWHPYATVPSAIPEFLAESTEGVYITLKGGLKVIDAMSSWWAAALGHRHPEIIAAAKTQIDQMPHVMFGGLSHEPAEKLAEKILKMLGPGFNHVFYADSGSISVEVALKMALQAQLGRGHTQRRKILTWRGGYHGDTLGAMSVCDPEGGMHKIWKNYVPQQVFIPAPEAEPNIEAYISEIEAITPWDEIAALILEPTIQGAGGMRMHPPALVKAVSETAKKHGVIIIYDEIATGFWRTGSLFAFHEVGFTPDIICLGKAITSGFMTFAATITTTDIAKDVGTLMHGPTFMANPLACSVALASLSLFDDPSWAQKIQKIEAQLRRELQPAALNPLVADVRVRGAIGVIELKEPLSTPDFEKVTRTALKYGVWIRPFGKLIYTMPPYISTEAEITQICQALNAAVEELS
ncbi:MAG: adenosylmethionine--8-amino-7-oxononanoate transaminase [Corynebacterium sp.]|nr:adenosylmethionine--8-amino-7-oxononanoate transaminase [Corynebacterium sp.]